MPWWKRRTLQQPDAAAPVPSDGGSPVPPEHAVLIRFTSVTEPDMGLDELERPIIEAIGRAGVGEFDGNDVGPDGATFYLYGPDADGLWSTIEEAVRGLPLGPGAHATKRYGPPGSDQEHIDLT